MEELKKQIEELKLSRPTRKLRDNYIKESVRLQVKFMIDSGRETCLIMIPHGEFKHTDEDFGTFKKICLDFELSFNNFRCESITPGHYMYATVSIIMNN